MSGVPGPRSGFVDIHRRSGWRAIHDVRAQAGFRSQPKQGRGGSRVTVIIILNPCATHDLLRVSRLGIQDLRIRAGSRSFGDFRDPNKKTLKKRSLNPPQSLVSRYSADPCDRRYLGAAW